MLLPCRADDRFPIVGLTLEPQTPNLPHHAVRAQKRRAFVKISDSFDNGDDTGKVAIEISIFCLPDVEESH